MKYRFTFLALLTSTLLVGCAQQEASSKQPTYEETKKMVVDILKTDEGKKAVQEIMTDEKTKKSLIMDQEAVTKAIEKNLTSNEAKKFWEKAMKDPKFAAAYAKGLEEEHKKILKALLNDPDYLNKVMEIWKDPEMQKELTKVFKSKEVREELKKTTIETVDSPLVKAKLQEILLKAAEELPAEPEKKQGGGGSSQTDTGASGGGSANDQGGGGGGS